MFHSDSDSEEEEDQNMEKEEAVLTDEMKFPKSFIFSCIDIGLTNIARKQD